MAQFVRSGRGFVNMALVARLAPDTNRPDYYVCYDAADRILGSIHERDVPEAPPVLIPDTTQTKIMTFYLRDGVVELAPVHLVGWERDGYMTDPFVTVKPVTVDYIDDDTPWCLVLPNGEYQFPEMNPMSKEAAMAQVLDVLQTRAQARAAGG